ncbi:unnamed protein product [Cuscuta campestris]|uniref:GAG-pre-integrase domain-containing protein n=1 Tax=Cuscuta campestris TaxID=132261 RepID=A0A484KZT4_9ASTE|nr:unnamed protein product [Cuscuta campestris]
MASDNSSTTTSTSTTSNSPHLALTTISNVKLHISIQLSISAPNYKKWSRLFLLLVRRFNLQGFLTSDTKPSGDNDTEWVQFDALLQGWILSTVTDEVSDLIIASHDTTVGLWKAIHDLFHDNKNARAMQLEHQFCTTVKGTKSMVDYCQTLKNLADCLDDIDAPVTDNQLVLQLLRGLPEDSKIGRLFCNFRSLPRRFWRPDQPCFSWTSSAAPRPPETLARLYWPLGGRTCRSLLMVLKCTPLRSDLRTGTVIHRSSNDGPLYTFNPPDAQPNAATVDLDTWHRRLGHPSSAVLHGSLQPEREDSTTPVVALGESVVPLASHEVDVGVVVVLLYHSVENGFRLPLHGLLRDLCLHFGFAPGQLTANTHKYVASFILRCCALDKTPKLDEFLLLFSIGGFPFYSLYPHNHFPIFEKVELKIDKWALKYFVIEFPAHSPIDLPGVVLRRSIPRTKFVAANLAEGAYNALREKEGLISHHSLQEAKLYKKADAALNVVPISAIPGLRRPTLSQKRPREGLSDDDFLPKKNKGEGTSVSPSPLSNSSGTQNTTPAATSGVLELSHPDRLDCEEEEPRDQSALRKPTTQPQTEVSGSSPRATTSPQAMEEEGMWQKEPEPSPTAGREVEVQLETEVSHPEENEAGEQKDAEASPEAQQSLLTLTEEYLGGASGNFRAVMLLRERELAARALQQKVDSLEQQVQILQGENARLQADGSTELAAERSKVQSLQDQIAIYHKETQDLEVQFGRFRAQISLLESRVSASKDQVGSLKAELVERESRISELENSLQEAKYEGSRLNELALKHMEARRLNLEKLKGERQAASELRAKVDEQEKTIAAHQEEVATMIARAKALYEEGQFDMQQCIYGAVQSGLPENRTLDDFISYYGLPLPLSRPASRADPGP